VRDETPQDVPMSHKENVAAFFQARLNGCLKKPNGPCVCILQPQR
jgi:hypothetical protein